MPFKPLVTVGIESLFSTFPYRSPALRAARPRLLGKALCVEVKGFSTSLILVFSERQVDILGEQTGDTDYAVIAYANVLPKLRGRQQPAALIRNGELGVRGDIQAVQDFVALADLTEFDPAELLVPYTGDIAVKSVGKTLRGGTKSLHYGIKRQQRYMVEAITEKWRMTPGPFEVAWFTGEMAAIECTVDALTKRLEKPKAK